MPWIQVSRPPPILSALLAAGIFAGLTGCRPETEASQDKGADDSVTDEARSALQVVTFDFLAQAPNAYWHNNDGGIAWGTNSSTVGVSMTSSGVMENGVTYPSFLYTHPKQVANGFMHAAYTVNVPAASLHPTVTATFGFKQGASGTDGVTFGLTTQVNGNWVKIFSQKKTYTGALSTVTADLSAYGGQSIQLFLTADAGANSNFDWAGWTDFRVTADSNTTPTACTIGGVNYASGAVNPSISCQVCDPSNSASAWTTRGDSCLIGSTCYAGGQTDALGCKVCDPNVSQTGLTTKSACDKLVVASTNWSGYGDFTPSVPLTPPDAQGAADAKCAAEGAALGLPGTWKGMISTSWGGLQANVPSFYASTPVVNLNGDQLYSSWSSIFTNQVWPSGLSIYAFGSSSSNVVGSAYAGKIWTGTSTSGQYQSSSIGDNCIGWTATSSTTRELRGQTLNAVVADFGQRQLISSSQQACLTAARLACVLIPPPGQVTVQNYDDPAGTVMGTLQAKSQGDTFAFLGVPYAAAPTGNLRFAPPARVTPWSGVRNAFNQPLSCLQKGFWPGLPNGYIGSEDCLYLNIWTPKTAGPSSNLPVLVFHHGGGLMYGGSASVDDTVGLGAYDGNRLAAAQNMIVVTLQTRLAAFGYLASPELSADPTSSSKPGGGASGNYGLLDAIQALKWIKKNIAAFGGDPNHVTMSGQSGGATLAAMLLSSPLAKDPTDNNKPYFASMLLMSGFYEQPSMTTRYNQSAARMSSLKANCTDPSTTVKCLRSAPLNNFVNAAGDFLMFIPNILNQYITPDIAFGLPFGPNIDGYVLPNEPRTTFAAGQHQKVPVIIGGTQKEFSTFMVIGVAGLLHAVQTLDITNMIYLPTCPSLTDRANLNLGTTLASAALPLYPCSGVIIGPTTTYSDAMTHAQYECPARRTAAALVSGQTQPVRRYMFAHNADRIGVFQNLVGLVPQIGAAHALDLPYLFNNHEEFISLAPALPLVLRTYAGPSPRERDLTTRYQSFVRAFAATGDPNNATLGATWTTYNPSQDNLLKLKVVHECTNPTNPLQIGCSTSDPGPEMVSGIDLQSGVGTSNCAFWDQNFALNATQTCTPSCSGKVCGPDGCGGTCGTCGYGTSCNANQTACLGPAATATLSGFSNCSCLNGSFALTIDNNGDYASPPITGCPGQTQTAYVKFRKNVTALGITNLTSSPGSGNSDYSPGTVITTTPYKASGGGSQAGNINSFCPGVEDLSMSWTVTM